MDKNIEQAKLFQEFMRGHYNLGMQSMENLRKENTAIISVALGQGLKPVEIICGPKPVK